ncbi:hypothetical protein ACJRO7_010299 [Eucalyptus globulus]|uniref:Oxysterol-binding protein n=1 Tax=Eucalyptus globulus TaxID=34317 RepID=A0ABD3LF21_EUCGL
MVDEGYVARTAVLTAPLSFDGESQEDYRAPNLLQRILGLFRNIRPGSDLTNFQLPPLFNIPKSQLQCFGEPLYCTREDMLSRCCRAESPLERLTSVVGWSISIMRPLIFGVAPYNPILGETHHVSKDNLNVLLEQVSHHPPVSALHATDDRGELEMIWCQHPVTRFYSTSVETEVHGKRQLKLLRLGETYVMNSPKLLIRFFPVPGVDWVGNVKITCQGTGLGAELCYRGPSLIGRNRRTIKGKIINLSSSKTLYEVDGHWDSTVTVKDVSNGKQKVIYNAAEIMSGLNAPQVKDSKGVLWSESAVVWSEVSGGILSKDWDKAREAKKAVEEEQRKLKRERDSREETWVPKHFTVSHDEENGWDCSPIEKSVPSAPIHVPFDS